MHSNKKRRKKREIEMKDNIKREVISENYAKNTKQYCCLDNTIFAKLFEIL
jgi:hypothetical protein